MRRHCLLFVALGIGALLAPSGALAARRALLVGVNDYPALQERFQLRGCENDVRLMAGLLTTKFGFAPADVKLLLSREATRDGIAAAFRTHLLEPAQPGDVLFFQFSGHGSQVADQDGDEEDGLDETLVPCDVGPESVDRQITDDQIARWLTELHEKGVRDVTFVVDACHSGTITKDLLLDTDLSRPRYVDAMDLTGQPVLPKETSAEAGERAAQEAPAEVVVISGCKADQQSNDARFGGTYYGALTYFLHAALQNASPNVTYAELLRDVQRRVQERFPTQTPQLDGRGDRPVLPSPQAPAARPFVVVTRADADTVQIAAGANAGVTVGSTYVVYPADDKTLRGAGLGTIEITAVQPDQASARPLRGARGIQAGCRAVEEAHYYPPDRLYVRVDGAGDAPTAAFTAALRDQVEYVALANDERTPDRVVKLRAADGRLSAHVITPDGLPGRAFAEANPAALVAALRPELENAYAIKLLARLENPNPSFKVRLSFDRETNPVYYFGRDKVNFRVQADRDCYITVLDIGTSGKVTVLFPNRFHPDNRVRAGQTYVLPSPDRPTFQIAVSPPVGREMVKVIATEEPVNLTGLDFTTMRSTFASLPDSLGFVTGLASRVRDFVVRARPQPPATAPEAQATPTAGWATDFVTFQIRDPREQSR
ncbi:MAG: DUF4384 domain-containing protein [Armatimonadetes bacterium]|nr:DUF4384 domain-containing protein [Armatimonadota bacterium]